MSEDHAVGEAENARFEVRLLGVTVGTAAGWDDYGDQGKQFYQFAPDSRFAPLFTNAPDIFAVEMYEGTFCYWPLGDESEQGHNISPMLFIKKLAEQF